MAQRGKPAYANRVYVPYRMFPVAETVVTVSFKKKVYKSYELATNVGIVGATEGVADKKDAVTRKVTGHRFMS
jgi:hypothetical protein